MFKGVKCQFKKIKSKENKDSYLTTVGIERRGIMLTIYVKTVVKVGLLLGYTYNGWHSPDWTLLKRKSSGSLLDGRSVLMSCSKT